MALAGDAQKLAHLSDRERPSFPKSAHRTFIGLHILVDADLGGPDEDGKNRFRHLKFERDCL